MVLFFILDVLVFLVSGISEIIMFKDWEECVNDFNGWGLTISTLSLFSMSLFFVQVYRLKSMKQYATLVEREVAQAQASNPDERIYSYDPFRTKRKLDIIQKLVIVVSILLDIGLVILSFFAIEMCATASKDFKCSDPLT